MLLRAFVHHHTIVVLRAVASCRDDVLLRAAACLSDMKSCKPACTMLDPASRRGRTGPLAVAVLRAHVSRTSVKIPAAACPRAIRRAVNGGEQRSARASDVVNEHHRRAREHATSFIAAEQRRARAARTLVQPQRDGVLCRKADNLAPMLGVTLRLDERRPRRGVLLLLRQERTPLLERLRRGSAPRPRRRVAAAAPGRTADAGSVSGHR